ncbi:MAG: hypothetical protein VW577_02285 [Pelagibacteraceae bacterium]
MKKDGHVDVASARRMVMAICEDGNDILESLPQDSNAELPTWWTNKLAVCSAYMNAARDYLMYSMDSETEEEKEDLSEVPQEVTENFAEEIEEEEDDMLPPSAKMVRLPFRFKQNDSQE